MSEITLFSADVPKYIENLQLPDPNLLMYYKNMNKRMFWVDGEITEDILEIEKKIIEFNQEDKDKPIDQIVPVRIFIFSNGGLLEATLSLVNVCELSRVPIYTYNMGVAMSAGLLLLLSGHKRFCLSGSRAMIHSGSGGVGGTFEQVEAASNDYKKLIEYTKDYILRRTKISPQTYAKKKGKDWYLYCDDQIQYGIVDAVITSIDEIS